MNAAFQQNAELVAAAAARARAASAILARAPAAARDGALVAVAEELLAAAPAILAANAEDLAEFSGSGAFADRLRLDAGRIGAMAQGVRAVAALPDPLARTLAEWTRPNGLVISRVPQPLGVIGMIYESRPNVGADAAALAIKSGNAILLRGGSESFRSAGAIHAAIGAGLRAVGLPEAAVQIAPTTDRGFVAAMLGASGLLDVLIPRGGKSLVERVRREARVPVLAHSEGLNHTYIHAAADSAMARRHSGQCEDAPHRRVRRHRDAADRLGDRAGLVAGADRRSCGAGLCVSRRRGGARYYSFPRRGRSPMTLTPSGWTRS